MHSVHVWRLAAAALMALCISLVWQLPGSLGASSHAYAVVPTSDSSHAPAEATSSLSAMHVHLEADCYDSTIGCCVMTHCHPGISVDPHEMTTVVARSETMVAPPVRGLGNNPGVILPPPRRSWL